MLLGILSDTHNELARTRVAVEVLRQAGVEGLIHCGDLASTPILEICSCLPLWFVFGNHDADSASELKFAAAELHATCLGWGDVILLGGRTLGVVHGHLTLDIKRITRDSPEVLFCGHSHLAGELTIDGLRRINPGALHRAAKFTVAVFETTNSHVQWLEIPRS
ncbi:phosphodiesterase [Planctopirus ephydatiae]|uniref:Phosphoesterase n=1 Tax=Planctopirus ephydatiae TaxID=2528019 RepID=A0A518GNG9_9PLAN|nr:metallophosphoesterase family protein [Planctopirus ephydatiae]QDV30170.1 phosphodiesterase [Planctopirus ephydatiae]